MANKGFFRNVMDAMIAAREKQAARYVNQALLMLDDETLKARGYSREALRRSGTRF
jgi:hypothetical protein